MKKILKIPNSIAHYTSIQVVHLLLSQALLEKDTSIPMHMSLLTMMNDSGEGRYVLDKYYTDSFHKKEKKEKWENEFYPNNQPFVFSTIATNINTRNNGSLPMWKMYGNDCTGALLRFNTKRLREYCEANDYIFAPCEYLETTEVQSLIKTFNKLDYPFDKILRLTSFIKHISWAYENEWRVVKFAAKKDIQTKITNRGIIKFVEFKIPIELIEEICIGPLANDNSHESLNLLKEKLAEQFQDKVHFKLTKSKITIK